ncbi:unnamed protein product [Calicophoron daubneyi]|uniref:Uncharacterized protein n=1 Tax=Calicophoron daubneyi TaxID=300641 RepID=A0AAV2TXZ0_CALDB
MVFTQSTFGCLVRLLFLLNLTNFFQLAQKPSDHHPASPVCEHPTDDLPDVLSPPRYSECELYPPAPGTSTAPVAPPPYPRSMRGSQPTLPPLPRNFKYKQ